MLHVLRRDTLRALVLLVVAGGVALADGARRGMTMPPTNVATTLPTLPPPVDGQPPAPTATPAPPTDGAPAGISPQQLHDAIQTGQLVVLDARRLDEYVAGHLPSAFSVPMEAFQTGVPAVVQMFPTSQAIVVYCGGGDCHASHNVASMLQGMGYTNVAVFEGGYTEWTKAGLPVEAGEPPL